MRCAAPIEPREVPLCRFRSPARLTGPFKGTFDRACTTLSNRRRSTKVPFPNIYTEVEIPVASNQRPVVEKTLIVSNLESIEVTSNVDVFYFTLVKNYNTYDKKL